MVQGRYLVVQLIGKGGMGEVYLAVDQRLGSAVALKRTSFAEDANLAAAFEREAKILARLRHPVLPKVSDHFTDSGDQFLVMEHISGDDLSGRLENSEKAFPLSWVMFWADQLLDALSYLHSHEPPIIHRDIKPQNLKLTDENHIVLLDFGLSKDTATLTVSEAGRSGSIVGYTPHFAPMEQIRGTGTNARSDIYSLSATLYQLVTNQVPPDALSRADTMLGSQRDPIKPPADVNPAVSKAVSDVILKGLEVSQEKRYATAGEMQKALRAAYAEIQTAMSADTAVFQIGNHAGADLHSTTPPLDTAAAVAPSEMATMVPTGGFSTKPAEAAAEASPVVETSVVNEPPVAMPVPVQEEKRPEPAVQPPADVPVVEARPEDEHAEIATQIRTPEIAAAAAAGANAAPAPPQAIPAAKPFVSEPPKKKSKAGVIVGGLVGLLVLCAAAGGGGWFAYTRYYLPSQVKSTPTPAPSVQPSASPQATAPVLANTNTNSDGNTNSTVPGNDANSPDGNSKPTPRATPPPVTKSTPAQTTRPTEPKATPKPKSGDDRKKIV